MSNLLTNANVPRFLLFIREQSCYFKEIGQCIGHNSTIKYNYFAVTKHIDFCFYYNIYGARMHVKNVFDFKRDDGCHMGLAWFMDYNASFNNISAIS